jgi:hypothetical protein
VCPGALSLAPFLKSRITVSLALLPSLISFDPSRYGYRDSDDCLDTTLGSRMITTEQGRRPYEGNIPLGGFEYGCVLSSLLLKSLSSSLSCCDLTDQMQWNITLN